MPLDQCRRLGRHNRCATISETRERSVVPESELEAVLQVGLIKNGNEDELEDFLSRTVSGPDLRPILLLTGTRRKEFHDQAIRPNVGRISPATRLQLEREKNIRLWRVSR